MNPLTDPALEEAGCGAYRDGLVRPGVDDRVPAVVPECRGVLMMLVVGCKADITIIRAKGRN